MLLVSCSLENITSNVLSSQQPESSNASLTSSPQITTSSLSSNSSSAPNSNLMSSLVTSSSASATTTSSITASSNVVTSSLTSSANSSSASPLANTWKLAMGNINTNQFYGITETLPSTLSSANVVTVHTVYRNDGTLYGYAYEALVNGSGGVKSNRFRVGLTGSLFAGFESVFHREHSGIGTVIIQALLNQLAGKDATFDAALQIMLNANATLTGRTATITVNGFKTALEAIVAHYLSKI